MTNEEKKRLSAVLRATEYLFLENIALKLVLERREVANWRTLLDHLLSDKEMMAGVRLKFSDLYRELEASKDPSSVLDVFLEDFLQRRSRISEHQRNRDITTLDKSFGSSVRNLTAVPWLLDRCWVS